jgi:hypothetical protein
VVKVSEQLSAGTLRVRDSRLYRAAWLLAIRPLWAVTGAVGLPLACLLAPVFVRDLWRELGSAYLKLKPVQELALANA